MGVVLSSSHIVSAAPSSSEGRLLTLFPCSSVSSLPQETVLHKLGIALNHMQDLALDLVDFHAVHAGPPLQPVKVPFLASKCHNEVIY